MPTHVIMAFTSVQLVMWHWHAVVLLNIVSSGASQCQGDSGKPSLSDL